MNKLFVFPQQYLVNWLSAIGGIQLLNFSGLDSSQQAIPIAIPLWLPQNKFPYSNGLKAAIRLRFQSYSNPILILTFHQSDNFYKQDEIGISKIQGAYTIQLPCTQGKITGAISAAGRIENSELQLLREKIFVQNYNTLLCQLKHGGTNDFVNNVTGPLRAACVIAKLKSGNVYVVNTQIKKIKNYFISSGLLDFIEVDSFASFAKAEDKALIASIDFFNELKLFASLINDGKIILDDCIKSIDSLNQKISFLKEI
ncbi:MAG: hypothetical protein ACYDEE_06170 [Ignavibacteriaceae bacterium]